MILTTIIKLLLFLAMQSAAVILIGFSALFLSFEPVWSADNPQTMLARPDDARSGSLLVKTDDGYAEAIRLGTDVDLTVSGPTIRARVTQVFRNPTQSWVEATYVYPLPDGSAVDTLKMVTGDHIIVGDIKERQQARVIYEQAPARTGRRPRSSNSSGPTFSPTRLPISARAKPCWCRSNIRSRFINPATNSRLGCRWSSARATIRSRWYKAPTFGPTVAAGAQHSLTRCLTATRISPPMLDPATKRAGESNRHHRASASRLSAWRGKESPITRCRSKVQMIRRV